MARLTKEFAIRLSEPVEDAYLECIDRLIINICKHLGTGEAYRTADWELQKLSELGQLQRSLMRLLSLFLRKCEMHWKKPLQNH